MRFRFLWLCLAVGIFMNGASGQEKQAEDHRLADWKFGVTLFGDRVVPRNLEGQVVVVQYWGVGCSSCLKSFARLKKLEQTYQGKGLRVVGAEVYQSGKGKIGEVVKQQDLRFSITNGVTGPISVSGLPYAVVFGPDGRLVFKGHPNEKSFAESIKMATSKVAQLSKVSTRQKVAPVGHGKN